MPGQCSGFMTGHHIVDAGTPLGLGAGIAMSATRTVAVPRFACGARQHDDQRDQTYRQQQACDDGHHQGSGQGQRLHGPEIAGISGERDDGEHAVHHRSPAKVSPTSSGAVPSLLRVVRANARDTRATKRSNMDSLDADRMIWEPARVSSCSKAAAIYAR